MDSAAHLEIELSYELATDGLCAYRAEMNFRSIRHDSPRYLYFRRDSQFKDGRYWQVPDCELLEQADDWLAKEGRAFRSFAPRLAGQLMRDPNLDLACVRLEWTGLVGPGRRGPRQSSFAIRLPGPGVGLEAPLYEYVVEPWTADLRYGLLASEPLPFEPVTHSRRRQRARTTDLVEAEARAYLAGFGDRD